MAKIDLLRPGYLVILFLFTSLTLLSQEEIVVDSIPISVDTIPFRVAQFGCPHSDVDMNALRNPAWKWTPRRPFDRGVQASLNADKACDVYHVLGDWSGQQSLDEKDELILSRAIKDDILKAQSFYQQRTGNPISVKSLGGNHISKHIPLNADGIPLPLSEFDPYSLYNNSVQFTLDEMYDSLQNVEIRADSGLYDYPWEAYYYINGNNLFFFLSDRNDVETPWGKRNSFDENGKPLKGGHPAGAIRKSSLEFFVDVAIKHSDKNIFLHTHQGMPNTVVGTSTHINGWRGHNDHPLGSKRWKGTIGALINSTDSITPIASIEQNDTIFNLLFSQWDQLVVGCANSHTHAPINYKGNPFFTAEEDEDPHSVNNDHHYMLNKTFIMNVGNLTQHHGHYEIRKKGMHPHGSIWEFYPGSDTLTSHKLMIEKSKIFGKNYYTKHGEIFKPAEKKYALKYPFDPNYTAIDPIKPQALSDVSIISDKDTYTITFEGNADAYGIVSSRDSIHFRPESFEMDTVKNSGKTYLPSYPVSNSAHANIEVLQYQGNQKKVVLPKTYSTKTTSENGEITKTETPHNFFLLYALNASNGKVIYSEVQLIKPDN